MEPLMEQRRAPRVTRLLEAARQACLETAAAAYEDAGLSGLCAEGRWECALDAIRMLDLQAIVNAAGPAQTASMPSREGD